MDSSLSARAATTGSSDEPPSPIASNRQRRMSEELPGSDEAQQAALEYQRSLPTSSHSVTKVLNPSSVTKAYVLTLPSSYAKRNMPQGKTPIRISYKNRQWKMKWSWTTQPVISTGWKAFCLHCGLTEGDVIVLTKTDTALITFHIKIFKRKKFVKQAMVLAPKQGDKNDRDLDIEDVRPLKRMHAWAENSSDDEAEAAAAAAAATAEGLGGGEAADNLITVTFELTESTPEIELQLKSHSAKFEKISNMLGVSSDADYRTRISQKQMDKILRLAFPLYDATPY